MREVEENLKIKSNIDLYQPVEICLLHIHKVYCVLDCLSHQNPNVKCVPGEKNKDDISFFPDKLKSSKIAV